MKAVMYHYVRPFDPELPELKFLHVDDFCRQLDHFAATDRILSRADFFAALASGEAPEDGILLTFDDGLSDHHDHVVPILRERGLWGIFYVPTAPYRQPRLLEVHRLHLLLARLGGARVLATLEERVDEGMLLPGAVETYRDVYRQQDSDAATLACKRLINYALQPPHREVLLGDLVSETFGDEAALSAGFYLSRAQLAAMADADLGIGAHGITHTLLRNLPVEEQRREIVDSLADLRDILGKRMLASFCLPYGIDSTYTPETIALIAAAGVDFCFKVESTPIRSEDLRARRWELPRFDCNEFPHGAAFDPDRRP